MFKYIIEGLYLKEVSLEGIEPEHTGVAATVSEGFLTYNLFFSSPRSFVWTEGEHLSEISGHRICGVMHRADSLHMCNKPKASLKQLYMYCLN